MRSRVSFPVLVLAVLAALLIGSVGTATAGGLTTRTVKKIAAKVVNKKASGLSVAHASSADTATNLGGVPAAAYAKRLFIRVAYTTATPARVAGSDGVTVLGEISLGRVNLSFPQDVSSCAIVGMSSNSGFPDIVRRSSVPTGLGANTVTIAISDDSASQTRSDFDLIAMC
jgi:hypothetical protein